jgi:predicted enzyme related to lactoylglutathione lyase
MSIRAPTEGHSIGGAAISKHGEYNDTEIPADDPARARRFHEAVAG